MLTRLMFVRDSSPVVDTEVVVEGIGTPFRTGPDGAIELEEPLTQRTQVRIAVGESWHETYVEPKTASGLYVVDLGKVVHDTLLLGASPRLGERYEFVKVLGRGGMGVVVEAKDHLLERRVAVKMLSEDLQNHPDARAIFLTEGRSLAKISHHNLVSIYDVTEIDDRVLMVMEFVEGRTLEDILKEKVLLKTKEGLDVAIQLTHSIAFLHEKGLIHRDIKPANAMVEDTGGRVKLVDFGLARSLDQLAIRGTQVRGTPAYMAPEQIRGEELSPKADVYQLGVTLYELFSGHLPFTEGSIIASHLNVEPPRIEERFPNIHSDVSNLIHSCLAKAPEDRPSAAALAESLEAIAADPLAVPVSTTSSTSSTPAEALGLTSQPQVEIIEQPTKSKAIFIGAGLLVVVLLLGIGVSLREDPAIAEPIAIQPEASVPAPVVESPPKPASEIVPAHEEALGLVAKASAIALVSSDAIAPTLIGAQRARELEAEKHVTRTKRKRVEEPPEEAEVAVVEHEEPAVLPEPEPEPKPAPKPEPTVVVEKKSVVAAPTPEVHKPASVEPKKKKKKKRAPVSF